MDKINQIITDIKSNKYSFVYFFAEWCSYCNELTKNFKSIYNTYKKFLFIKKINIDQYKTLTNIYNINSIPTIIIFKNGIEINRFVGPINKFKLINICKNLITE